MTEFMQSTAIAYARYSSDNQREESIMAQLRAIREYAEKNNINIIKEYIDEAKSASVFADSERPAFEQMLSDINNRRIKVDYILFHKLDRGTRNDYDLARLKYYIRKNKFQTKIIYVDQPLPEGPEGTIMEQLMVGMAQYYSENLSREVRKGMRENALAGLHRGGIPPLGYAVDPATKKYIIVEHEAAIVRKVFQMVIEGETYKAIEKYMAEAGAKNRFGKPYKLNSIHDLLKNPKYCGKYIVGRFSDYEEWESEAGIPAIVEPAVWETVQKIMEQRKIKNTVRRSKDNKMVYLLTGKLVCGTCGGTYHGNVIGVRKGKNQRYYQYICTNHKRNGCPNPGIQKEVLEDFVLDKIEELFDVANYDKIADTILKKYAQQNIDAANDVKRVEAELAEIRKKMDKLFEALETGALDAMIAGPRLNALGKEKEVLEQRLQDLQSTKIESLTKEKIIHYLTLNKNILNDRTNELACKRLIEVYVERVVLGEKTIDVELRIPKTKKTVSEEPEQSTRDSLVVLTGFEPVSPP